MNGNGKVHALRTHNNGPRKVLETPGVVVYDDFLPEDDFQKVFDFASQIEYSYINTHGKVRKVWDITNGFPLRSERNIFYYADEAKRPNADWAYPSKTPFDRFIEGINRTAPNVSHLIGEPNKHWQHFSVTGWLYPQSTGLSFHDDGAGVYSGAYAFFMSPEWKPHWGGLLLVMSDEANQQIRDFKKQTNALSFHKKKWLHQSEHAEMLMENGLAHCVFPKRNRIAFIQPDAWHMVTNVNPAAGENVRMSLAGFFHCVKKEGAKDGQNQQQGQNQQPPPSEY